MDKLHIELYSIDGEFQGYANHVSMAKQKVESTNSKSNSLSFSTYEAAKKISDKIEYITKGCLKCSIS